MIGRLLFLVLLIVEIGAAVGWIAVVVSWAFKQNRHLDFAISTPHMYGVGLPIVVAVAITVHMAVDGTSRLDLWWIPVGWLALASLMLLVRRVQNGPRRIRRAHHR